MKLIYIVFHEKVFKKIGVFFFSAYHHHFGRQCRVADYGFTKLIELFETIPTIIEITEDADGERILQLTDAERLVVVSCIPGKI